MAAITTTTATPAQQLEQFLQLSSATTLAHHQIWRYDQWLAAYPLNRLTAMDYFKHSRWYDSTANNEILAMQELDLSHLTNMQGVEYQLDPHASDDYLLIHKQYRYSRERIDLLALYYIVTRVPESSFQPPRGTVFHIPPAASILQYNLHTSFYYLNSALRELQEMIHCNSSKGTTWQLPASKRKQVEGSEATPVSAVIDQSQNEYSSLVDDSIKSLIADSG